MGRFPISAADVRTAATLPVGFPADRRSAAIAQPLTTDFAVNGADCTVSARAAKQRNDQFGAGTLAYLVSIPAGGDACPVKVFSGWLWFLEWLKGHKHRDGSTSGSPTPCPLGAPVRGLGSARRPLALPEK